MTRIIDNRFNTRASVTSELTSLFTAAVWLTLPRLYHTNRLTLVTDICCLLNCTIFKIWIFLHGIRYIIKNNLALNRSVGGHDSFCHIDFRCKDGSGSLSVRSYEFAHWYFVLRRLRGHRVCRSGTQGNIYIRKLKIRKNIRLWPCQVRGNQSTECIIFTTSAISLS